MSEKLKPTNYLAFSLDTLAPFLNKYLQGTKKRSVAGRRPPISDPVISRHEGSRENTFKLKRTLYYLIKRLKDFLHSLTKAEPGAVKTQGATVKLRFCYF